MTLAIGHCKFGARETFKRVFGVRQFGERLEENNIERSVEEFVTGGSKDELLNK